MASVTFEQVTKQYENGYTAVKDLNIELEDKEFLGSRRAIRLR